MVTEDELRAFLKQHRWGLRWRTVDGRRIAHAQRRVEQRVITRYIAAESKLVDLTEADVLGKIQL